MSQFARQLDGIDALGELSTKPGAHWWKDLLSLWRPSGVEAGDFGLRLAIRNGYLNFYRRGQSIARIEFDRKGTPTATMHIKYVGKSIDAPFGREYVKLRDTWILRGGKQWDSYRGSKTLEKWIKAVDEEYVGTEKNLVDQLVTANPNVIDLEMGLPAWGEKKTAPRIDLVAIESSTEGRKVVFWEAKLVTDGRLRCSDDVVADEKPEVLKQLADYRKFLNAEGHVELVAKAYLNAAKLIVKLRAMADGLGEVHPLGAEIVAAASSSELSVDCEPRLVVLNKNGSSQTAWAIHADKLRQPGVKTTVIEEGGSFVLMSPA